MPDNNVVQVGQEGDAPGPETLKRPCEDLDEDERSGIQTERECVKKVELSQVQKSQVSTEVGTHRNMRICLRDVQRGHEGWRREQFGEGQMVVEAELRSNNVFVQAGQVCDEPRRPVV